jgi:hypothetical protein
VRQSAQSDARTCTRPALVCACAQLDRVDARWTCRYCCLASRRNSFFRSAGTEGQSLSAIASGCTPGLSCFLYAHNSAGVSSAGAPSTSRHSAALRPNSLRRSAASPDAARPEALHLEQLERHDAPSATQVTGPPHIGADAFELGAQHTEVGSTVRTRAARAIGLVIAARPGPAPPCAQRRTRRKGGSRATAIPRSTFAPPRCHSGPGRSPAARPTLAESEPASPLSRLTSEQGELSRRRYGGGRHRQRAKQFRGRATAGLIPIGHHNGRRGIDHKDRAGG